MHSVYGGENSDMRFSDGEEEFHFFGTIDAIFQDYDVVWFGSEK